MKITVEAKWRGSKLVTENGVSIATVVSQPDIHKWLARIGADWAQCSNTRLAARVAVLKALRGKK